MLMNLIFFLIAQMSRQNDVHITQCESGRRGFMLGLMCPIAHCPSSFSAFNSLSGRRLNIYFDIFILKNKITSKVVSEYTHTHTRIYQK